MKKIFILVLIVLLSVSALQANPKSVDETVLFGEIHNSFYMKPVNILIPIGDYLWGYNMQDASEFGFGLNFGSLFYFHKVPIGNILKFGLDVTYLDANLILYKRYDPYTYEDANMTSFLTGMKVGPVISINPVSTLIFDTYFQVEPSVYGFEGIYDDFAVNFYLRQAFGLNVSYSKFMLGFEMNMGKMSEEYSIYNGYVDEEFKNTYTANYIRFSFGFKF